MSKSADKRQRKAMKERRKEMVGNTKHVHLVHMKAKDNLE
jgi:hypothetical protein